jgi:hypothetical protein
MLTSMPLEEAVRKELAALLERHIGMRQKAILTAASPASNFASRISGSTV